MRISGSTIKAMMRSHRVTIATLAERLGVTQKRVRQVREQGLDSYLHYCDWHEAITGINIYRPDQYHE
jgi:predicted transcriptional regulator